MIKEIDPLKEWIGIIRICNESDIIDEYFYSTS